MKLRTLVLACLLSAALLVTFGFTSRIMLELFALGWNLVG